MRMSKIVLKIWMLGVELTSGLVDIVSALGDCQREDQCARRCHLLEQFLRIVRREGKVDNRANHASRIACQAPLDQSIEAIL